VLEGTAVTQESFAAWRASFEAEVRGKMDEAAEKAKAEKLSGKQYFAVNAEVESWEEPEEEEEVEEGGGGGGAAAADGGEALVDEALFDGEDDDSDFDDLSDDEDEDEDE
jgi:hypothetical protein